MAKGVYLIHFEQRISAAHTTQHYLGYADDINARFDEHASGRGARLTQVAVERGIPFRIVRTWEGKDRRFERKLKKWKNSPKLCPCCNQVV